MLQQRADNRVLTLHLAEPMPPGSELDALAWALLDVCEAIQASDEPPLAVALTAGGPAFWVRPPERPQDLDEISDTWASAVAALAEVGPPTVAAIRGEALGPALDLALACDLRLIAVDATVGYSETRLGRLPVPGAIRRLTRSAGGPAALRLLLLGEILDADAAAQIGLVHRTAPDADLAGALDEMLASLRLAAPVALTYVKEAVGRAPTLSLDAGLRLEADLAALLMTTADRAEGIAAFQERRTPLYEGR